LGQDGSLLADYLLELGYDVYGVYKRVSTGVNFINVEQAKKNQRFHLIEGDITDASLMTRLIQDLKPDEFYCLGAQSHVGYSFGNALETIRTNNESVALALEAIRHYSKDTRLYFACSSEIFGGIDCPKTGFDENSPTHPRSPYAATKEFGRILTRNYREAYGIFACSGILFNHSSVGRRGVDFFTRKLTTSMAKISLGQLDKMKAGNLQAFRDEGAAEDYVRAQHLILQQSGPDDFVVSMGEGATMLEMLEYVCELAGLDATQVYEPDERFMRPSDVPYLLGNSAKIRALGWEPKYNWRSLLKAMYQHDLCQLTPADRPI